VNAEGIEIGVFRVGRNYYALMNYCPHQGGPVCTGRVSGTTWMNNTDWKLEWIRDGEIVTCPWHGLEYEIPSGKCVAIKEYRLKVFPVKVESGKLRIEI
jgi:nitrite reductase/ring-hydroxylating ferredoxin subunit